MEDLRNTMSVLIILTAIAIVSVVALLLPRSDTAPVRDAMTTGHIDAIDKETGEPVIVYWNDETREWSRPLSEVTIIRQ